VEEIDSTERGFTRDAFEAMSREEFLACCEGGWLPRHVDFMRRGLGIKVDPRRSKRSIGPLLWPRAQNLDDRDLFGMADILTRQAHDVAEAQHACPEHQGDFDRLRALADELIDRFEVAQTRLFLAVGADLDVPGAEACRALLLGDDQLRLEAWMDREVPALACEPPKQRDRSVDRDLSADESSVEHLRDQQAQAREALAQLDRQLEMGVDPDLGALEVVTGYGRALADARQELGRRAAAFSLEVGPSTSLDDLERIADLVAGRSSYQAALELDRRALRRLVHAEPADDRQVQQLRAKAQEVADAEDAGEQEGLRTGLLALLAAVDAVADGDTAGAYHLGREATELLGELGPLVLRAAFGELSVPPAESIPGAPSDASPSRDDMVGAEVPNIAPAGTEGADDTDRSDPPAAVDDEPALPVASSEDLAGGHEKTQEDAPIPPVGQLDRHGSVTEGARRSAEDAVVLGDEESTSAEPPVGDPAVEALRTPTEGVAPRPADGPEIVRPDAVEDGLATTTVAELISAGRFGLAYWTAQAAGWSEEKQAILAAAAYAKVVRSPMGSAAGRYRAAVADIDEATFAEHPWLLQVATASAVRVALIAPYNGAGELLRNLRTQIEDRHLAAIVVAVIEAENAGASIADHGGKEDDAEGAPEENVAAAVARAQQELERLPQRTAPFQRATAVWRRWLAEGESLGSLLRAAAQNDIGRRHEVERSLIELRDPRTVDHLITETDLAIHGHTTTRQPIEARALAWLHRSIQEVLEVVATWAQVTQLSAQGRGDASDHRVRTFRALQQAVTDHGDAALEKLAHVDHGSDGLAPAGGLAARDLLAGAIDLVVDGNPPTGPELAADLALSAGLLRAVQVPLDGLEPLDIPSLEVLRQAASVEWSDAYRARSAEGNHEATGLIVDILRASGRQEDADRLAASREAAINRERAAARELHDHCETELASARRQGHLDADLTSELTQRLEAIRPAEDDLNFPLIRNRLDEFLDDLRTMRGLAADDVRERLADARREHPQRSDDLDRIEQLIDRGILDTAEEFLTQVLAGMRLPAPVGAENHLLEFYPEFVARVAEEGVSLRGLMAAIEGGEDCGPATFDGLTEDARERARQAWNAWFEMGELSNRNEAPRLLRPALALLGLEIDPRQVATHPRDVKSGSSRTWLDVKDARYVGKAHVHQFGSSAGGAYRLLLCWSNPTEDMLLEWVRTDRTRRPIVVLYFGTLDVAARNRLARELRSDPDPRDVMLIDDALMLYAAAHGGGLWSLAIELAMPFTGINPYTPYVTGNVPPEVFFGRRAEVAAVMDPNGSLFIYGGRQLGKSAILRAAERDFRERGEGKVAVYLDLKARGVGLHRTADAVLHLVREALEDAGLRIEAKSSQQPDDVVRAIRQWLMEDEDRQILCLLDEADAFLEADSNVMFRNVALLKELLDTTGRRFKPVFAGLHQVQRYMAISNQPLAHLGEHIAVTPLSPQPAYDLASRPLHAVGYRFADDELAARLLNHTNYQPGIVQLFCSALVRHLLGRPVPRDGVPPYAITADDIEKVYADPNLLEEIRKRFEWTIALDSRYKVIAYVVANAAAEFGADHRMALREIRDECYFWWPAGFEADTSIGDFKALVEEMIGLGVLAPAPTEPGVVGLRSPNILRMLGTKEDIRDVLLEAEKLEPKQAFDIASYRRPLRDDPDQRSPVTEQQLNDLLSGTTGIRIILGSRATGIEHVPNLLKEAVADRSDRTIKVRHLRPEGGKIAAELRKEAPDTARVLIVDCSKSSEEQTRRAFEQCHSAALERRAAPLRSLLLVEPDKHGFWTEMLQHSDPGVVGSIVELGRWGPAALRVYHAAIDVPMDEREFVQKTLEATGGWPTLIHDAGRRWRQSGVWDEALATVDQEMATDAGATGFLGRLGLTPASPAGTLYSEVVNLAGEDDLPADLLGDVGRELAGVDGPAEADVLRAMQLLTPRGGGFVVEPITAAAWRRVHMR
jgi:hypothetical protein